MSLAERSDDTRKPCWCINIAWNSSGLILLTLQLWMSVSSSCSHAHTHVYVHFFIHFNGNFPVGECGTDFFGMDAVCSIKLISHWIKNGQYRSRRNMAKSRDKELRCMFRRFLWDGIGKTQYRWLISGTWVIVQWCRWKGLWWKYVIYSDSSQYY